eukprot:TRINITY_DN9215_c0_g1_i1.p1 TRINITY_DN9215_c0_g1~~TRINITY_DN9215_c0_g1_i1.p1  ORF type:complete len:333 (+),score=48.79 TRINITY_DN9215_c0_g1_i1:61-1059(+)
MIHCVFLGTALVLVFVRPAVTIHAPSTEDFDFDFEADASFSIASNQFEAAISAALENVVRIAPPVFSQPPGGTTKNLFVPAMHRCDEKKYHEFLKRNPGQARRTAKQDAIEKSLGVVHDVLSEVGLPTILEAGSLLGFIRNCGVIPTDMDGDVAVLGHWLQGNASVAHLTAAFARKNASLQSSMCPHGPGTTGCELRAVFPDLSYIDVFVYATERRCFEAPCSFFNSLWPGGRVGPFFHKCDTPDVHFEQAFFLNKVFWIPTPPQKYLKLNYGPEWVDVGSGVYKTCHFDSKFVPSPDVFADLTPSADYVRSLEATGAALAEQVIGAQPFEQ